MSDIFYRTELSPNDSDLMGSCDAQSIQNAIDAASRLGINKVKIPRYNQRTDSFEWLITETIKIPSFMDIVLDHCYMRLADGASCSIFANALAAESNTIADEQEGISICGAGTAVLDGGLGLYFRNVKDIKISDITIRNQDRYGLCFTYCRYATVRNVVTHGQTAGVQQAAMELRTGCNNFIIENVICNGSGDTLSMTAVNDHPQTVMGKDPDIHDVIARNIKGDADRCCIVGLRNRDSNQIYNILLEGVMDASAPYSEACPACAVSLGEKGSGAQNRTDGLKNITVRNVFSRASYAVCMDAALMNCYISNVHVFADGLHAIGTCAGADLKNVHVEGVFYHPEQQNGSGNCGCAFKLENSTSENFTVKNVFIEGAAHVALLTGGIQMKVSGLYCSDIGKEPVKTDEGSEMILC